MSLSDEDFEALLQTGRNASSGAADALAHFARTQASAMADIEPSRVWAETLKTGSQGDEMRRAIIEKALEADNIAQLRAVAEAAFIAGRHWQIDIHAAEKREQAVDLWKDT